MTATRPDSNSHGDDAGNGLRPSGTASGHDLPVLSQDERHRYSRHILLPEIGVEGQRRLKASKVLIVGAGGLGSPAGLYLAAAGVGTIGLVDFDTVDASNLQRQILYSTDGIGKPKLDEAKARIQGLNPGVEVVLHAEPLSSANALDIVRSYDIVLDGTDNFPTRYLVNDACELLGKPNVYGSVFRFEGQVSLFNHAGGPTYRDLYPEPPPPGLVPSCAEGGVLGVLPGVVGTLQATEAIKVLTGVGETLSGRLLLYDALDMRFDEVRVRPNPDRPLVTQLIDYEAFCNPAGEHQQAVPELTVRELAALRDADPDAVLLDVREPGEVAINRIEGSLFIPLGQLPSRVDEVPRENGQVVVLCKKGPRSAQAVRFLRENGIDAVNLRGGIDAWADAVEPGMARY